MVKTNGENGEAQWFFFIIFAATHFKSHLET